MNIDCVYDCSLQGSIQEVNSATRLQLSEGWGEAVCVSNLLLTDGIRNKYVCFLDIPLWTYVKMSTFVAIPEIKTGGN